MANGICVNCFGVKGARLVCPRCGYKEGTPPKQPHYLKPGTVLAKHIMVGMVIGVGGFGITYKCYDMTLGVIVAVKEFFPSGLVNRSPDSNSVGILSGDKTGQYKDLMRRFLMEAQSIAQFGKAKDIVNVYDYFEENNTAYIIMEYIDGLLLKDYLAKKGRLDQGTALALIEPIVEAVKKIHAKGILHRDISPDNIFIAKDNTVKVFDFGAARLNDGSEGVSGDKVIKVGYSAPEQYRATASQGYYTDIYSVGAILYQMVTGRQPVESTEREYQDLLKSPLELGISIDPNLDRAIMEALAVQPELRFQGIISFDEAIHGARLAEYPKEKLKRRKRKRIWMGLSAAVGIVAVIVGIAFFRTSALKENIIFSEKVKQDVVTVWVDSDQMKKTMEKVVETMGAKIYGGKPDTSADDSEDSEDIQRIKKEDRELSFIVRNVTAKMKDPKTQKNYFVYNNMDEALAQTDAGNEKFPDIVLTDHVKNLEKYEGKLYSYEENIYQNMDTSDYLYMAPYADYFRSMKEMPTAVDALLLFCIEVPEEQEKTMKAKKISSSAVEAKADGTVEYDQIIKLNEDGKEKTMVTKEAETLMSILNHPESFDEEKGNFTEDAGLEKTLERCVSMTELTQRTTSWKLKKTDMVTEIKQKDIPAGTSIMATAGYRSILEKIRVNDDIPLRYKVYVPTAGGKMIVQLKGKLAISSKNTENQRLAALRFVYFAMGQQNFEANRDTPYPISVAEFDGTDGNKTSAFDEFFRYNDKQERVRELIKEKNQPCMLIGKGSGTLGDFAEHLPKKQSEVKKYVSNYLAKKK